MNPETLPPQLDITLLIPAYLLVPVFLVLMAGWIWSHVWSRPLPGVRRQTAGFLARTVLGFLSLMAASELARQGVVYSTSWNVWALMLIGAVLVETSLALSRLERTLISRRAGRALTLLRMGVVLAVLVILCQPVRIFDAIRRFERRVVVLLDVSASMQVPDNNMTGGEKVRWSEALHIPAAHRTVTVDRVAATIKTIGQDMQAQSDGLNALAATPPEVQVRQIERQAPAWNRKFKQWRDTLVTADGALKDAAAAPFLTSNSVAHAAAIRKVSADLTAEGIQPLDTLITWAGDSRVAATGTVAFANARKVLGQVAASLLNTESRLSPAGDGIDEAFYRSLSTRDRETVDQVAALLRSEVAARLLLNKSGSRLPDDPERSPALLERLHREYGVQFHTFGAFHAGLQPSVLLDSTNAFNVTPAVGQMLGTDIADALENAASDLPPEQVAGIILLSDGRHNAAGSVETAARRLGTRRIPVFPVIMGAATHPPTDAAIASLSAPESVSTNDRVSFTVDLKLDGLAGTNVTVTLLDGLSGVASNTMVPATAAFRKQILLSDVPKADGLHHYRVQVESFPREVDYTNNVMDMPVMVSSDPVKVLLLDAYPRWEFRYLKNLFMQRDKNVRLQYLLLHPDQVAGITNRPPRAASVSGDSSSETEATLLPANEAEWMKFDVIILGDVAPHELGQENQRILRDYVVKRGGSLIVLAGARHMPQSYDRTPLAEVFPVTFTPSSRPLLAAPEAEFRLSLTAEGRNAMFMKLDDDAARNLAIWNGMPTLYWRNGSIKAKDGATVLAYAEGARRTVGEPVLRIPDAEGLARQRQTEKDKPLLVTHQAGFGSVLLFGYDHTWRLRYRTGDEHHHKFWGQILRWATAERIAAGSATVRVGTSRSRYTAGSPVRVIARLATDDYLPITNASPRVIIRSETGAMTLQRPLRYREGSPGLYAAEISSLPEGRYRLDLESAGAGGGDSETNHVFSQFAVTAAADSEKVELAADSGLMSSIAALTAGRVLDPGDLASLPERLGPPRITQVERRQIDLWNSWPWLLLIVALLTAEWVLRKRVRLP
jgi:hypothetical protein